MHFIVIAFLGLSLGPHGSAAIHTPDGAFLESSCAAELICYSAMYDLVKRRKDISWPDLHRYCNGCSHFNLLDQRRNGHANNHLLVHCRRHSIRQLGTICCSFTSIFVHYFKGIEHQVEWWLDYLCMGT
jgi:hypothetical protein